MAAEFVDGDCVEVENPVALDDFTTNYQKISFAKVRVEIDSPEPLKLGVLIRGQNGVFWQPLIYEKVTSIYYKCG